MAEDACGRPGAPPFGFGGVVFDLFHTLADPERFRPPDFHRAFFTAAFFGLDPTAVRRAWEAGAEGRITDRAFTLERTVRELLREAGRPEPTSLELERYDREVGRYQDEALLRPDEPTLRALAGLRSAGRRLGLLSNVEERDTRAWERSPLRPFFDAVSFSVDLGAAKPAPEAYLAVLTGLGLAPRECVYVGDGGSDELAGARRVGFGLVIFMRGHVSHGFRSPEACRLFEDTADVTVDDLGEMVPLALGGQPGTP